MHAAAAVAGGTERTAIEALHVRHLAVGQERTQQAGDEVGGEVRHVRVAPHDDVAARRVDGLPHGHPLAGSGAVVRQCVRRIDHHRTRLPGDAGRGVGRTVVHHEHLVHERDAVDERLLETADDHADGRLFVARGQAHRDALASLGLEQRHRVEVVVVEGADHRLRPYTPGVGRRKASGGECGGPAGGWTRRFGRGR